MIPAGQLLAQLYDDLDASDDDKKSAVRRRLNLCYLDIAQQLSWAALRRTKTLTFTGTATGIMLPANLVGIDCIYNTEQGIFTPREKGAIGNDYDTAYRYAIVSVVNAPLEVSRTGATIKKFTSAISGLGTDRTGEFITFANRLGIYELTSQTTIAETFFEENVEGGGYTIRPQGTRYVNCYDTAGNPFAGSVTLDYWIMPQPITDDSQAILFPTSDALAMFTTMRHIGLMNMDEKRARAFRAEYNYALMTMKDLNPIYVTPNIPIGMNGTPTAYAAQP